MAEYDLTVQINAILEEYTEEVVEVTQKAINKVCRKTVQNLKSASAEKFGNGRYARGWTSKYDSKNYGKVKGRMVYNATDYQLTHLLENGHMIVNKYGTYGRWEGIKHIQPAEQQANIMLEEEVRKGLK